MKRVSLKEFIEIEKLILKENEYLCNLYGSSDLKFYELVDKRLVSVGRYKGKIVTCFLFENVEGCKQYIENAYNQKPTSIYDGYFFEVLNINKHVNDSIIFFENLLKIDIPKNGKKNYILLNRIDTLLKENKIGKKLFLKNCFGYAIMLIGEVLVEEAGFSWQPIYNNELSLYIPYMLDKNKVLRNPSSYLYDFINQNYKEFSLYQVCKFASVPLMVNNSVANNLSDLPL